MKLLLNAGGPNRVSRVQMAEAVAHVRGYDNSLIKQVSASSVSIYEALIFRSNCLIISLCLLFMIVNCFLRVILHFKEN